MSKPEWEKLLEAHRPQEAAYNVTSTPERKASSSPTRLPSSDDPRSVGRLMTPEEEDLLVQDWATWKEATP